METIAKRMAAETGVTIAEAERHRDAFHHVVDRLVTDGVTVVAPPLIAGYTTPTFERLRYLIKRDEWVAPEGFCDADWPELASALGPVTPGTVTH